MGGRNGYPDIDNSVQLGFAEYLEPIEQWVDGIVNATVPTASALPASGNTVGRLITTEDTGVLYLCVAAPSTWVAVGGKAVTGSIAFTDIYKAGSPVPDVYQLGDRVGLEGMVASSTANFAVGNNYIIGSIPASFAPASTKVFACLTNVSATAWVTITPTGTISFFVGVNFSGVLNLSLENCQWRPKGS